MVGRIEQVISLKKLISSVLFLCFVSVAAAAGTIPEDFYINDGKVAEKGSVFAEVVLPSALRVSIREGEKYELYADLLPENTTEKRLVWRVREGERTVLVSSKDNNCILTGRAAGDARISVTATGGAYAEVSVEVKPQRTETPEGEGFLIPQMPEKQEFYGDMARGFSRTLIIAAGGMFIFAGALWITGRKKNEKR